MIALERQEMMLETAPRVTARGHLELVDWAPTAVAAPLTALPVTAPTDPVRRSPLDRLFESGVALLFAASVAAICACMTHL